MPDLIDISLVVLEDKACRWTDLNSEHRTPVTIGLYNTVS